MRIKSIVFTACVLGVVSAVTAVGKNNQIAYPTYPSPKGSGSGNRETEVLPNYSKNKPKHSRPLVPSYPSSHREQSEPVEYFKSKWRRSVRAYAGDAELDGRPAPVHRRGLLA